MDRAPQPVTVGEGNRWSKFFNWAWALRKRSRRPSAFIVAADWSFPGLWRVGSRRDLGCDRSQAVPWEALSRPMHADVTAVVILAAITISPTRAPRAVTA
jgi:hypothetical protein